MEGIIGQLLHLLESFAPSPGERRKEYWGNFAVFIDQVIRIVVIHKTLTHDELYIAFEKIVFFGTDADANPEIVCRYLRNLHAQRHGEEQLSADICKAKPK